MIITLPFWNSELNAGLQMQILSGFSVGMVLGLGTRTWDQVGLWYLENSRMMVFFKHLGEQPINRKRPQCQDNDDIRSQ